MSTLAAVRSASPIIAHLVHPVRAPRRSSPGAVERRRWIASRAVAIISAAALVSVLPTPLRGLMHGLFGDQGVLGPVAAATAVALWSVGLLLTARGLRHGHRLAWALTLGFLVVTAALHGVWHTDLIETTLTVLGAGWLVLYRSAFGVRVAGASITRAGAVTAAVACVIGAAGALPEEVLGGLAPALLLGTGFVGLVGSLWTLLSPQPAESVSDQQRHRERERARRVVLAHGGGTLDYFALRDDKRWFFHAHSVVAYAVRYGVCLVSPDPIGPPEERTAVWAAFTDHARARGWSISILGAGPDWLETYRSFGLRPVYLGDEAVVDCVGFSLGGRSMRSLRQACNRVDRAGYTVTFHPPADLGDDARREILDLATVSRDGAVERGFSMTLSRLFDPDDVDVMFSISRDAEGRARGFIQWVPAPAIDGWSLDVMRYDTAPGVPNGVMDHLIVHTIGHLAARGGRGLALNFAVLRHAVTATPHGPVGRGGQRLLELVSGRTQIASLCHFNQKFGPEWQPRFVVLSSLDTMACQALMIAAAEGLTDIPLIGRFMRGVAQ